MAEASGVDLVQQLLTAAANPKLTPGPWSVSGNRVDLIREIGNRARWEEDAAFIAAARNGIRALAEEWLQTLVALDDLVHAANMAVLFIQKADCPAEAGHLEGKVVIAKAILDARRGEELQAFLEATKP